MKKSITTLTQTALMLAASALLCCVANTAAAAASIGTPTYNASTSPTDLSAVGTLDWELYGKQNGPTQTPSQSKNGSTNITMLAPVITSPNAADNSNISRSTATFSWSDGTPTASGTAVDPFDNGWTYGNAAVANYYDSYETVTFVPGDTKPHTIHLYGYESGSPISFQFSNSLAGASSVVSTFATPVGSWDYSVTFQANNPTDVFTVVFTFQKTGATSSAKRMGIQAATINAYVPTSLSWQGNVNSAWNIATTANWTNSSGAAVNYTETAGVGDSSATFDDTAVNYLVNVTTAVQPLAILVNNSTNNYVLSNSPSASIGGPGALTKQGTGILTLVGSGNSFSNGVVVSGGTLRLGTDQSIPDGAGFGIVQMSGTSTLDLNGHNETINGLSGSGTVDNVAGGGTVTLAVGNNNASGTFSGTIQNSSGTVVLSKTGTGSLTLSGTNTFAGGITLNAGQLNLNSPGALGTGPLTIAASGVLLNNSGGAAVTLTTTNSQSWNGDFTFVGTRNLIFGPGAVTMNASRVVTVNGGIISVGGPVAGSGLGLTKAGTGQLQILSSNTFNGPIQVNAGSLQLSTAHLGGGSVTLADSANLQVNTSPSGTTLNLSGLTLGATTGATNVLTFNCGTNANPTTALITVGALTPNSPVTINVSGSGLDVGQFPLIKYSGSIGGLGYSAFALGTLPYPNYVATLVDNAANHSVDLNITAAGGSPKIWVGNVNGNWNISTTTNWVDSALLLPATYNETIIVGNSVQFDDTASNTTVNVTTPVKPYGITVNNSNLNYSIGGAAITGSASFTKSGAASLTLTGNNTFTNNFNFQGGTVYLGTNSALGAGLVNWTGGTLSSDGATARTITNALAIAANSTFGDGGVGSGSLNFSGSAVLGGYNQYIFTANVPVTFSGGFTNGGFYKAGSNSITLQSGTYPFANYIQVLNGTLTLNGATVNNQNDIRVVANQTNGTSRLVVNGGSLTGGQLRLGFADFGNTTAGGLASMATNIVDVAGLLNVGNNSVTMGRSAAWCELNLLTNGTLRTAKVQHADSTPNNTPEQFTFNGGTLQASTNSSADSFMAGLDNAYIMNGGAVIDSAGFDITIGQLLQPWPSSTGGLTKVGNGTLTLTNANTYTGARVVNQGKLVIFTASTGGGAITVSNGASLGVTLAAAAASLNASDATFGTASTHNGALDINFAAYAPDLVNAPLNLTGNLAANGTNTINITATNGFYVGQYPLIKYAGSMAPGAFSAFKLGNMPAGSAGVLVNNTGNQSIDLNVTNALPPPLTWTANTDTTWDTSGTLINWQTAASVPIAYTESAGVGAVVTFNDSAFSYSVNITTPVHPSGVNVNTSYGYTIGGSPIAGTGALTKSGANILTLTSSNSYSGGTTVAQGTVLLGASGALGSGMLTLSGGTLTSDSTTARNNLLAGVNITSSGVILGDAVNTGRLNLGGTVNWNNAEKTLTIPSDVVLSGGSTNGSFSKTGTGVLTLQGTHAFTKLNDVFLGDVVLDGATATSIATSNIRVGCNVPNSQSRLVLTNGASFVNTVGSSLNIGATGGDTTSTNILDLAGRMATSSGAVAYLGASCALGGVNLLNGGVLEVGGVQSSTNTSFNGESRLNFNGGTLRANASSTTFLTGLTNVFVLNGGAVIDSSNYNITVTQPLLQNGSGGLTKNGSGVLTLDSTNTYTGLTLVSAGTLSGTGTIAGALSVGANGSLAPGHSIGTFTINGALTINSSSTNYFEINAVNSTSDRVTGLTAATYGGTLVVSNLAVGTPPTNSQTFQLFSAVATPSGNFSTITPAPAAGLAWSFNPTNGVLKVVAVAGPSGPGTITNSISGSTLTLTWPTGQGWRLVGQTNNLSTGLNTSSNAWFTVPGGVDGSNSITINPANPTVFYKLVYP